MGGGIAMSFEMSIIKQQAAESDECKRRIEPTKRPRVSWPFSLPRFNRFLCWFGAFHGMDSFNPSKQLKLVMCNEFQERNRNLQAIHIVIME